jgi:hypothetical protein
MTISEHLEFSVLTAPIASIDRRALSQAWYSALYGANGAPPKNTSEPRHAITQQSTCRPHGERTAGAKQHVPETSRPSRRSVEGARGENGVAERRAPRSGLARKIESAFLRPRAATRKAVFAIDGSQGRVQLLLQSHGGRMKLIAICPEKARNEVASALAQARYALAQLGIGFDGQIRSAAAC